MSMAQDKDTQTDSARTFMNGRTFSERNRPTLSVVMANYNHAKYLPQAISAITSQSRPPDELIVLDDGSTDDSLKVLDQFAARIPYIRVIKHATNKGLFAASTAVFAAASGEYVYAAAADDYVFPGFFQKAMELAQRYPVAGVIFGGCRTIDEQGNFINTFQLQSFREPVYLSPDRYLTEYVDVELPTASFSGSSIVKRVPFLESGGYRPELLSWCDTFAIRVIALKYGACYLPTICTAHRMSSASYSGLTRNNHRRTLEIIARAAGLMRGAEFRNLFPEPSVRRWEQGYRALVLRQLLHEAFSQVVSQCQLPARTKPREKLEIMSSLGRLLRTGEYSTLFPEEVVMQWEQELGEAIKQESLGRLHISYGDLIGVCQDTLGHGNWVHRVVSRVCQYLLKLALWLSESRIAISLNNVPPGVQANAWVERELTSRCMDLRSLSLTLACPLLGWLQNLV